MTLMLDFGCSKHLVEFCGVNSSFCLHEEVMKDIMVTCLVKQIVYIKFLKFCELFMTRIRDAWAKFRSRELSPIMMACGII